jgi:hypothetical protein
LAIVLAALPFAARAQTFQFLPEIDAYYKFDPNLRVYFQAKDTREGGAQNSAEIGPSLDFHIKSLEKLRDIAAFDLDESKSNCCCSRLDIAIRPLRATRQHTALNPT